MDCDPSYPLPCLGHGIQQAILHNNLIELKTVLLEIKFIYIYISIISPKQWKAKLFRIIEQRLHISTPLVLLFVKILS